MHNLWLFVVRFNVFFLFIIFQAISLFLLIQNNDYQKARSLNSANAVIGEVYSVANQTKSYFYLSRINDSLAVENARLRNQLVIEQLSDTLLKQVSIDTINNMLQVREYTYLDAKVVNNTVSMRNNYLTLNRGEIHGVRQGMGVICEQGVVGIVKDVSENFCTVVSLLHKDMRISSKLNSTNVIGSLVWEGHSPNKAQLKDIPNHVEIKEGELITTTGFSLFPEGVKVGVVEAVPDITGDNLLSIDVRLSTNFQTLQYVYIVFDKFSHEKKTLEAKLKYD